jgi:hypothetical protein
VDSATATAESRSRSHPALATASGAGTGGYASDRLEQIKRHRREAEAKKKKDPREELNSYLADTEPLLPAEEGNILLYWKVRFLI